jgi:predicted ester cyclase
MATGATSKPKRKKGAKTIAREYFEAIAAHDVDKMASMWAPGGKGYIHGMTELEAPQGLRAWFTNLFDAFPDFEMEILDIVAAGDQAAVRWRSTATFTGPSSFEGMAPTGARGDIEGFDLLTISDGKIRENRAYMNAAELGRQLGAMPAAGSTGEKVMLASVNARTAAMSAIRKLRER